MTSKKDRIAEYFSENLPNIKPLFKGEVFLAKPMLFLCRKHNSRFELSPSEAMRQKYGGCKQCSNSGISERKVGKSNGLKKTTKSFKLEIQEKFGTDITLISKRYLGARVKHEFNCSKCSNNWETKPVNLMQCTVGCPSCGREQAAGKNRKSPSSFKRDLSAASSGKIKLIGEYNGDACRHKFKCTCGNKFTAVANTLLQTKRNGCSKCSNYDGNKKYSQKSIRWLKDIMVKKGWYIQHAENGGEVRIPLSKSKVAFADGYCEETNTVFEFHGDIWHGNLQRFSNKEVCSPFSNKTAKQLNSETHDRHNALLRKGYNVIYVWESHFDEGKLVSGILYT